MKVAQTKHHLNYRAHNLKPKGNGQYKKDHQMAIVMMELVAE